jgi:hypothetical protein
VPVSLPFVRFTKEIYAIRNKSEREREREWEKSKIEGNKEIENR